MNEMARALILQPCSPTNPAGVVACGRLIEALLTARGFHVHRLSNKTNGADILVARREPRVGSAYVCLHGHYDVEEVKDNEVWLINNPFIPTERDGRLSCRGVADNLGPLLQRIFCLDAADDWTPGLLWILHGEEEVGKTKKICFVMKI